MTIRPLALAAVLLAAGCTLTLDPDQYAPKTAAECGALQKVCGYKCVPLDDPATGCAGPSCEPCQVGGNAVAQCGADPSRADYGQCVATCNLGWGDCYGGTFDGCETRLNEDFNCGACGRSCTVGLCSSSGYCDPGDTYRVAVGDTSLVIKGLAADPAGSTSVYFAGQGDMFAGEIGHLQFVPSPTASIAWSSLGDIANLSGDSIRLAYSLEGPAPSLWEITPISGGTEVTLANWGGGTGESLVAVHPSGAWWVPPDGNKLVSGRTGYAIGATFDMVTPVGRWTALASLKYSARAVVGDAGGHLYEVSDVNDPNSSWAEVGSGAGYVGALGLRTDGLSNLEVYWGDLATGNVWRQVNGNRTLIYRGAGPTSRMRMATNALGVYWLDETNRTVMAFMPENYPGVVVPLWLGRTPQEIAAGTSRVFFSSGDREIFMVVP